MSLWPFSRNRESRADAGGPPGLHSGLHRSPGFAALYEVLERRRPEAILDLGPTSTENVQFLSRWSDNISIQDLYRSCRSETPVQTGLFRFGDVDQLPLPAEPAAFDVLLVWDLIHYFERRRLAAFGARLAALSRDGAVVLLMASSTAPVPLEPLRFKIVKTDTLEYTLTTDKRIQEAHFTPREVELAMPGFRPMRFFQLRNGLQEFLFTREG